MNVVASRPDPSVNLDLQTATTQDTGTLVTRTGSALIVGRTTITLNYAIHDFAAGNCRLDGIALVS